MKEEKRIGDLKRVQEMNTILNKLGIGRKGRKYIEMIVSIYIVEPEAKITKLYENVATFYGTTPYAVAHHIRTAIKVACLRADLEFIEELFGYSISKKRGHPTNLEFVKTIADRLRFQR